MLHNLAKAESSALGREVEMDTPTLGREKATPFPVKLKAQVLPSQMVPIFILSGFLYFKNHGAFATCMEPESIVLEQ